MCELGCYSRAARKLHITEGSVSHHVAAVEDLFGSRLLTRTRSGSRLTDEGMIALEAAREVFKTLERARLEILNRQRVPRGTVKVEASTIPGEHILPEIVALFLKAYPQLDCVDIRVSDSLTAFEKLRSGDADMAAVGTLKIEGLGVDFEKLAIASERLVVVVPREHPLAKRSIISVAELKGHSFVDRAEGSGTRIETERLLHMAGLALADLKIRMRLGSTESVISAVSRGGGVSILSEFAAAKAERASLIKVLRIRERAAMRKFYLIRAKKRSSSKAADLFWEFCRARRIRSRAPFSSGMSHSVGGAVV